MKILKWVALINILSFPGLTFAQDPGPWKSYYDSTQLFWEKDWNRTVGLLEHAEKSALTDLGLYHENYLTILNDLGTAYWKARDYSKAEDALTKSLRLKSEIYPLSDKEVVLSISNLAGFYAEQGLWKKSKSLYHQILALKTAHNDILVGAAQNLISIYDMNGQADSAEFLLHQIEELQVISPGSYFDFQHRFYRARVHRKLQQYAAAEKEIGQLVSSLSHQKEDELRDLYVRSLQERGILFLQTGVYSQAEKTFLEAYRLVTPEMNREHLLTELSNNLAQVYDKLNIYDKALTFYRESLGRCKETYSENELPCVVLQNNIAGVHLKENNIGQAITDYQKVIAQFEKLLPPSDPLYITALNNLATAYRKNNQYKLALEHLNKAGRLLRKNGLEKSDLAATLMNNIAVLKTAEGDYVQAALNYQGAYDIKRGIYGDNSIVLMDLISNLAVTYWALNRPADAIPLFKKAMELARRQVSYIYPNLNENEQVQFYHRLREDFERFNTIAIQWADKDGDLVAQAFRNRTVIKSLQFLTHQRRTNDIGMKNDPMLNELVARLKECRDRLGHLYQLPLSHMQDGAQVTALEKEIDELEKTISLQSATALYGDDLTAAQVDLKDLVPTLNPNEAIVEMVRFRKYDRQTSGKKDYFGFADSVHYAALIVTSETKDRPRLVLFRDGNNLETRFYTYYKNALKYNVEDTLSYQFFWAPLESSLAGKVKIFFSADGVYHKINVNTLLEPGVRKYLLEKFDIVYLLNPIQLLQKKTPASQLKRDAVLIGDPVFDVDLNAPRERTVTFNRFIGLPGTQQELRAIDKVLKAHSWKTRLLLKAAATESNLKEVNSPRILHLASHGFFSDEVVSLNAEAKKDFLFHSGIVLTGANQSIAKGSTLFENDGIVTAFEVMNLDLRNTELVVLSACETGLGKIENGEGVFGLQRSFMQAGAANVLISLWKVDDDATRDLMIKFYQYLAGGASLNDSLKKAQTDQAARLSDPSLWGGFVLVGSP